jgi:hypothetical protein
MISTVLSRRAKIYYQFVALNSQKGDLASL